MISQITSLIKTDTRARYLILFGLLVQVLYCMTATGVYHPDQHFQLIEFATWKLGEPSAAELIWELDAQVRPTLQAWLFMGWHESAKFIGIQDPYLELTLLRLLVGLVMFLSFNAITIYFLKDKGKSVLHFGLLLLNFSWLFPYTRTLFSSEMISSLLFFLAVYWYDLQKERRRFIILFLVGLLLSFAFYMRFQTGFLLAGFAVWMILEKKWTHIPGIIAGFLVGIFINIGLDYKFYDQLVFTPYRYFQVNILEQKAASFGTSSPFTYIGVLLALTPIIPVSLFLYYYAGKSLRKNWRHLMFLCFIFFFIGHSLVGHKEERFMFPVLNAIPIMLAWGLPYFREYYQHCKKGFRIFLKTMIVISIILNTTLLILLMLIPYSQTPQFMKKLSSQFAGMSHTVEIHTLDRSPFETPSKMPFRFYEKSFRHKIIKHQNIDFIRSLKGNSYFTATYDQIQDRRQLIDSMGFKPMLYSSKLLWEVNEFLYSKKIHTINDIWILYYR